MPQLVYIILGPPHSGLDLLSNCLRLTGLSSLQEKKIPGPKTINHLLFQDLRVSSLSPAPLPRGWLNTPAAGRARDRIQRLLNSAPLDADSGARNTFLSDSLICRTLPLWQKVLKESKLTPKYIFLQRHPFETAMSLAANENLDLNRAHLVWLSHTREALRALQDQDYSLITLDQLLADPVSICRSFLLSSPDNRQQVTDNCRALLDHVQPSLKHHHASNLPEEDRQSFKSFELLYQQIRLGQHYPSLEKQDKSVEISGDLRLKNSLSSIFSGPDLIDSLLQALAQQGHAPDSSRLTARRVCPVAQPCDGTGVKQPRGLPVEDWGFTGDNRPQKTGLYATITFPSSTEKGEVTKTIPLIEDQWQKISLPVPEPELVRVKPIILKPLNTNGTVKVSTIKMIDWTTGKINWEANRARDFDALTLRGTLARLPERNNLSLLITGKDPRVEISVPKDLWERPLVIEVWIKGSLQQDKILSLCGNNERIFSPAICSINNHFIHKLKALTNTGSFHQQFKARNDEFEKISVEKQKLIKTKTFWGADIHVLPQNEIVSSRIYSFGFFEPELCSFFIDFLVEEAVVLDVGAHIGFFSMLGAELVGKTGQVFSFEPTPSTREVLELNLKPYSQQKIVTKAAWSSKSQLNFHDYGIQFSAFNTAVSDRLSSEQKKKATDSLIKVDAVTLDSFCAEHSVLPNLIKIDVESSEMQVIQGMRHILDRLRPVVTIEVGDMESTLKDGVPLCRDILELVMQFDYLPLNSVGGRYHFHELQNKYVYDNIIMVPIELLPMRRPLGVVAVQGGRFY